MVKSHLLLSRKDFSEPPPLEMDLIKYFNHLSKDNKMHVCVISGEDESPRVYMEKSSDERFEGIVRAFYKIEDAELYADAIVASTGIDHKYVKRWDINLADAVNYFSKLSKTWEAKTSKKIKLIASKSEEMGFSSLDLIWTDCEDFVV